MQGKIYSEGNENTYTGAMIGQLKTCRYFVNGERLQVLGWFDKVPAFGARALERVQQAVAMQHHLLHQAFRSAKSHLLDGDLVLRIAGSERRRARRFGFYHVRWIPIGT